MKKKKQHTEHKIHDKHIITGETRGGSEATLTIWLRTQYDENVTVIGLELSNNKERIDWKEPRRITKAMVRAIRLLLNRNPGSEDSLWFESSDLKRIALNQRLFKKAGYDIEEVYPGKWKIKKIHKP